MERRERWWSQRRPRISNRRELSTWGRVGGSDMRAAQSAAPWVVAQQVDAQSLTKSAAAAGGLRWPRHLFCSTAWAIDIVRHALAAACASGGGAPGKPAAAADHAEFRRSETTAALVAAGAGCTNSRAAARAMPGLRRLLTRPGDDEKLALHRYSVAKPRFAAAQTQRRTLGAGVGAAESRSRRVEARGGRSGEWVAATDHPAACGTSTPGRALVSPS